MTKYIFESWSNGALEEELEDITKQLETEFVRPPKDKRLSEEKVHELFGNITQIQSEQNRRAVKKQNKDAEWKVVTYYIGTGNFAHVKCDKGDAYAGLSEFRLVNKTIENELCLICLQPLSPLVGEDVSVSEEMT